MSKLNLTNKIALLLSGLFLFVGISGYFVMINSENTIIENQSMSVAEIVARQASAARSVYSDTEYVESREILHLLDKMNIDYAQGYFIQKPIKVDMDFKSAA